MVLFPRRFFAVIAVLIAVSAPAAMAQAPAQRLGQVLLLDEVAATLRIEGLTYGDELDRDILGGSGGSYFRTRVSQIYDPSVISGAVIKAISDGMTAAEIDQTIRFFETDAGQRILQLELSARRAMADPAVDDMAQEAFEAAVKDADARLEPIRRFVELNDLVEYNVAGALASNYQFLKGLVDGGGDRMGDGDILDEVWSQEDDIRASTRDWVNRFLFLAYGPLSASEMEAYLGYCETPAGLSLNAALFAGFDEAYRDIYYDMGRAVAQAMQSSDL
ncbi:DUF2059 domain-containing protein [Arenibacterium sp. CAU 1754]